MIATSRRTLRLTALAVGAAVLAGCTGGGSKGGSEGDAPGGRQGPTSAAPTASRAGAEPVAELTSQVPLVQGEGFATLTVRVLPVVRHAGRVVAPLELSVDAAAEPDQSFCAEPACWTLGNSTMIDPVGLRRWHTLRRTDLPSSAYTSVLPPELEPGTTYLAAVPFPDPGPAVPTVSLGLSGVGVVSGVPVTDGDLPEGLVAEGEAQPAPVEPDGSGGGDVTVLPTAWPGEGVTGRPQPLVAGVSGGTVVEAAGTVALPADVLFAYDRSTLSARAGSELAKAATLVRAKAEPGKPVLVVGHTDAKGGEAYNARLSAARAEAAATQLRRLLPGVELTTRGRGAVEPVAPNEVRGKDNPAGRALNRRVEISYTPRTVRKAPQVGTSGGPAAPDSGEAQPAGTFSATLTGAGSTVPVQGRVYPVRRDGSLALLRLDLTASAEGLVSDYFSLVRNDKAPDAWALTVPAQKARYGVAHEVSDAEAFLPGAAPDATALLFGLDPGRTYPLWAYTALPPEGVKTVDVDLGAAGVVKNVPVQ